MNPSQESRHKGSILVIDVKPASLKLLLNMLTEHGYAVHPENEVESGLKFAKHTLPDLVLVDIRKSDVDGYRVCAMLKSDPSTRAIPVIFVSSIDHFINQAKAFCSGAVDYVTEPFDAEEVLWRIDTHISLRRLRDTLESGVRKGATQPVTTNEEIERALQEIHVLTQVTERKHAEEKIREREAELRQVLELAPQHIAVLGPDGGRLYSNQAALNYYGLTLEEWRSCEPRELIHPDDRERMTSEAKASFLNGSPHETEGRILRSDGKYHWFLFRGNPVRDGQGLIARWYVAATDIQERTQAEEALRQTQAALAHVTRVTTMGEMTASIAHEVNQPLAAVVTNAAACLRWISGPSPDLEEGRQALERIVKEGKRASEVIARIRALVRKSPPRKDWLDINETIQEIVLLTGSEAHKSRISVQTQLSSDLPRVLGDRIQLQQVVLNLIKNAIDAMAEVGEAPRDLLVSSGRDESKGVLVAVRDSGPGPGGASFDHLFDPFYTTKADGLGMGLAISRSIVEAHGGRLWGTPNAPRGATFQFTLPAGGESVS